MRKILSAKVIGATLALAAAISYASDLPTPPGDPELVELLSGISYVPNRSAIDTVLGSEAIGDLILIAKGDGQSDDAGLRIRAYRALGDYEGGEDSPLAREALVDAIAQYQGFEQGVELLFLRSSMISLAKLVGEDSSASLLELLDHQSRDIRVAAAQAIEIANDPVALPMLRQRAQREKVPQVQLALSEAIISLEGM